MQLFELASLLERRRQSGRLYHEFLHVPALSAGLYQLAAGAADPQQPHSEDELYYVLSGRGVAQVGDEEQPISAGSILYVPARAPHRFHTITEELTLLVFFAPAEGNGAAPPT